MKTLSTYNRNKRYIPAQCFTLAIASLIVAVLVGLVLFTWVTQDHSPPIVSVISGKEVREMQGQFYVPFAITNTGGETAESVQVIGELRINGEVAEAGEQQIDFLSKNEKKEGAFIFSRNPRNGELLIRVASYKLP